MVRFSHWVAVSTLAVASCSLSLAGCDSKDSEKCDEGQRGVRASLKAGDSGLLKKWRDYAFEYCEDSEFDALDREIQETEAAKKQAEAEKKKKEQEKQALLSVFLGWVGTTKSAPDKASAAQCEGDKTAEKEKRRWCTGDRMAPPHRFEVTYWEDEPAAAVYRTQVPQAITCEDLGPHTVVRSWTVQGSIKRHHCQITGGSAAGMQALVTEATNAPLEVFSARFVELHGGMKKKLEGM